MECPQAKLTGARNGVVPLNTIQTVAFVLVFMTVLMPQMDGIEASQRIRADLPEPACHTPILGLTANVNTSDKDRFMTAGANEFLLKPFARKDLMQVTRRLLVGDKHPPIAPG